jgi:transposase
MSTPVTPTYDELATLVVQLQKVLAEQAEALKRANARIADLEAEILRLKNGGPDAKAGPSAKPDWVKLNKPEVFGPPAPRKPRPQGFTHHRLTPTKEVVCAADTCPDCGRGLSGGSERSRRQVIDLPPITPTVTDYILHARYCGVCQKSVVPTPDLSEVVVGQQSFGLGVVSLVAYLDTVGRLPVRTIASLLSCLLHLSISVGQIVSLLHTVAKQGEATYHALQQSLRASEFVHADETGWRENGKNGYVWSFSTPLLRYFVYDQSRAHTVPKSVLGESYRGILLSDFYSAYSYHLGWHQRCWVHLLRDVHALTQGHPSEGVRIWAAKLRALYEEGKAFRSEDPKARARERVRLQRATTALATPYVNACLPQSVLCKRLVQFESEMYTFVEFPQVPSENNAAERSVRPLVIMRKISGGTRTEAGSKTMAILASLFGTWLARGEDAMVACRQMLIHSQRTPRPQTA